MSCVSTPTATQFSTVVSSSVSTSFSEQVTTIPGTTSTIVTTSCLSSADVSASSVPTGGGDGSGSCVLSTVITSTTVIGGGTSTTQVPVTTITDSFTSLVPTNTLFAPCTDTTTSTPTTTTSLSTEFSESLATVLTTPTTTFTSSQDSTLDNGSVTQVIVTFTSALPPTSSVVNTPVPIATTQANDGGGSSSTLGAIIGGSIGGFVGLLAIVGAVWFFRRRRRNWDDIFEKDYEEYNGSKPLAPSRGRMLDLEDEPVYPAEVNTEPKPYVYGLVGSKNAVSPPSLNAGLAPTVPASRPSTSHTRSSSMTPLMANNNAPASRPGSSVGESNVGGGVPLTPPATGGRTVSPGPLGVSIPTGPIFPATHLGGGESPTSMTTPRGPLFVANQLDPISPAASPAPGSPGSFTAPLPAGSSSANRSSLNVVSGPSIVRTMSAGAPAAAYAYLAEKQRLQRDDTVSSGSVYSQPSRAPSPPLAGKSVAAQREQERQQKSQSGVVVHMDAGRVAPPPDQPPAYQG